MKTLVKPFTILFLSLLLCLCLGAGAFASGNETASDEPFDAATEPTVEENAADFIVDLDDADNAAELAAMVNKGYIAAFTDGSLRPGRSYTRLELAQFVTAICGLEIKEDAVPGFYDTEIFGCDAIDAAVSNGLMTGRSETAFDPYGNVLKAELLSTLQKAAKLLKVDNFDALTADADWSADYTICSVSDAMHLAYILDTAVTEARDQALKDAAELLASLTENDDPQIEFDFLINDNAEVEDSEDVMELPDTDAVEEAPDAVGEAVDEAAAESSDDELTADETDGADAAEPDDTESTGNSAKPLGEASGEASAEAETAKTESTPASKPAGVSTPSDLQAETAQTPVATAQPAVTESSEPDGQQAIIQQVKDIYNNIRNSIVDFFQGLF